MLLYVIIIIILLFLLVLGLAYKYNTTTTTKKVYISGHMFTNQEWNSMWGKMLNPSLPIVFTTHRNDANIILVINQPHPTDVEFVNSNKGKTIIAHMEYYLERVPDPENYLDVWTHDRALNNVEWFFPATYDQVKQTVPTTTKTKGNVVSVVLSSNYTLDGHKKRIDFVKYLEDHYPEIELDIYGRDNDFGFKNYQGVLPNDDKSEALYPYKYHFNCENAFVDNYITEKFTDGILCETYLFYGGPTNVLDVYPTTAYSLLDMDNFDASAQAIKNKIQSDAYECELENIRALKDYILTWYSLSPRLARVIQEM